MKTIRHYCQHVLNPLHVFCRLRSLGMPQVAARSVSRVYELSLYRLMFDA